MSHRHKRIFDKKNLKGFLRSRFFYIPSLAFVLSTALFYPFQKSSSIKNSDASEPPFISAISDYPLSIQHILKQPEDKIDVGVSALTFAKEIYPDIDIEKYSSKMDTLANRIKTYSKGTKNPDLRIRWMNTVMLLHEKFKGTRNLSTARQSEKYYLNRVLDNKQGNCSSVPLLYIAIGQRLGWPLHLVHVPDHSFVRYVDSNLKEQNIEPTSNGGYVSNEKYIHDFKVSKQGIKSGAYLQNLTVRELLGEFAAINGVTFGRKNKTDQSILYLKLSTEFNPRNVSAWMNLNIAYKIKAKRANKSDLQEYLELAKKASIKMDELGFVNPKNIPQIASARRL